MKKIFGPLLFLANIIVVTAFWWNFSGELMLTGETNSQFLAISRLAGLLATQLALAQLILIGRIKWIESVFGLDKLSRIHKWNGYLVLSLIILHIVLVTKAYSVFNGASYITQYISFLTDYDDVFKAFLAYLILLGTVVLSITIIRKKLKYEYWYYVHILNYLTFILFVGHQLELGMSSQSSNFQLYWMATYIFTAGHISWFRFLKPILNFIKHDFAVSKIQIEGPTTSVFISVKNLQNFKRQAGQFMIFRFFQKGFWYEAHPFSLSWGANKEQLRITAKNLGDYTAKMPFLKVGTKVLIDGPHGVFTSHKIKKDKVLMIAGGIGITPIRSLAEELAGKVDLTIIYSAKTQADAVLMSELKAIRSQKPYNLIEIYSAEKIANAEFGMLDKAKLGSLVPDLKDRDVFLCGPPPMMDALKVAMQELGLPNTQLHWERFAL